MSGNDKRNDRPSVPIHATVVERLKAIIKESCMIYSGYHDSE